MTMRSRVSVNRVWSMRERTANFPDSISQPSIMDPLPTLPSSNMPGGK